MPEQSDKALVNISSDPQGKQQPQAPAYVVVGSKVVG